MNIDFLNIFVEDGYVYDKHKIWSYLIRCFLEKKTAKLYIIPEGPSAMEVGLYNLLDEFCASTGYLKQDIIINTGNPLEQHKEYSIKYINYLEEHIFYFQQYLDNNLLDAKKIKYHFALFIGRPSWERLWMATEIFTSYRKKTLMTYRSSVQCNYRTDVNDGIFDKIGLEKLLHIKPKKLIDVSNFLNQCPITDINDNVTFPILPPENLNLIKEYKDIFLDIVCETYVLGDTFYPGEKTWRPLATKTPFIVMGPRDYLHNLRKLGFKTFYEYWDEDYDGYSNETRMEMILLEIEKLSKLTISDLNLMLNSMEEILTHNQTVLKNLSIDDLNKAFDITIDKEWRW